MTAKKFVPAWREDVPSPNSYRSIFKYIPNAFKHPSAAWYEMFKAEFGMTDADFQKPTSGGDEVVTVAQKMGLLQRHVNAMSDIVGAHNIATDDYSRVRYGHGKSLDENLDLRKKIVRVVPDLVVHPRNKEEIQQIVAYCHKHEISIVTYGAGSGVVLGTRADKGGIALVMRTHMNKVLQINETNKTCTVQPGMMGPDYEHVLNQAPEQFACRRRYTCGHFPQSFEISSVGGWIAALGSGQASSYYGDAYDLVISQEYVTPVGTIRTQNIPGTATGPKVNDIFKGSEGAFGVLVEVTMKIFRHMPENRRRFAYMFPTWEASVEASREIFQAEFGVPAVYRISDPEETENGLKLKGHDRGLSAKYFALRGLKPMQRSLCIGTVEGDASYTDNVRKQISRVAKSYGGVSLSGYATKLWEHGRYADVHMREDILDYGMVIETLETGVTWDNLHRLHQGVREFVKQRPGTCCMTHASHFYEQGTNLYFIFILKPESEKEFFAFRSQIISRIVECGGSISHHHGIGKFFAPWMETHLGSEELAVLQSIKRHFDPKNLLNPGVLAMSEADPGLPSGLVATAKEKPLPGLGV